MVRLLLKHGANANKQDALRDTPLHLVVQKIVQNTGEDEKLVRKQIVSELVSHTCDVYAVNVAGKTPLSIAVERGYFHQVGRRTGMQVWASSGLVAPSHGKIVELLLNNGAYIHQTPISLEDGSRKRTPLSVACSNKHVKVAQIFLKHGAHILVDAHDGESGHSPV
jgi:ankyrin repeat protein